jgi:hypothetical protein
VASRHHTFRLGRGDIDQIVTRYLRMLDASCSDDPERTILERAFVRVAKSFSESHGVGYDAWRDVGVPADVLSRCHLDF